MSSIRRQIAEAIIDRLDTVTSLKWKSYEIIKMKAQDFQDFELPAAQIIDLSDDNQHERTRGKKTWNITIELVVGPTVSTSPSQGDLWDLLETVEQALFALPNLGITEVIHMRLLGSTTDLHILQPFYTARVDLQVDYYQVLVSPC